MITVAKVGFITEAAKELFISQPSLSGAVKEVEKRAGIPIFTRCRIGIAPAEGGMEFSGYAYQVVQQMESLELKYISNQPTKQRLCISTRRHTFTANAFVELVQRLDQECFELILDETQTHRIIMDAKDRLSDIRILYFSNSNKSVLQKNLEGSDLVFHELSVAFPHVFLYKDHPLANQNPLKLKDLQPYPGPNFVQGNYGSDYSAEELLSDEPMKKSIKVSDRAAIVSLMIGLDRYTVSSRIFPKYLQGDDTIPIPLNEDEMMCIGYILNKGAELTELGGIYIDALKKCRPR